MKLTAAATCTQGTIPTAKSPWHFCRRPARFVGVGPNGPTGNPVCAQHRYFSGDAGCAARDAAGLPRAEGK